MNSPHCNKERENLFRGTVVPLFAPVRRANLNGYRPWSFPAGTTIDEDGRPTVPLVKNRFDLLMEKRDPSFKRRNA
jgi:hypothetical protein